MIQSGYLESDIWQDGFIDPAIWYAESVAPDITSGAYDDVALTITANGEGFRAFQGSGALYYQHDGGGWVAVLGYTLWSSTQIIASVPMLGYGTYDLKVVTDTAQEDILLGAFLVTPGVATSYYTDLDQSGTGLGTEGNPWNLDQLISYFNHDTGYWPFDGDTLYVKGDVGARPANSYLFMVNVGDSKTITMRAWGQATNGMYTISTADSGYDIFRFADTNSDVRIIMHDAAILTTDVPSPSSDPIVIAKSMDNTIAANRFELKDCMVIGEQDISMTGADTAEKTNVKIFGSTLSFGGSAVFEIDEYSDTTLIYDSVVNLVDTASINATGTPVWSHCEFNTLTGPIPGTKNDCTFGNASIERLPSTIEAEAFYENDFNYGIYEIANAGNGSAFWILNDIQYDIVGYTRTGIGAFRFEANTYTVDGSKQLDGDGSSGDAFTLDQMRNYFDSSQGTPCGVSPTGFDTFEMVGIFTMVDDFFININENIGGYTTIKCSAILTNKAWFIEVSDYAGLTFDVVTIGASAYLQKLIVNDMFLTQNNATMSEVKMVV